MSTLTRRRSQIPRWSSSDEGAGRGAPFETRATQGNESRIPKQHWGFQALRAKNVGAVVVKDFGNLIGILTERDLLKAMAARVHSSEARVRQWMTVDPVTAAGDTDVEEAARVMLEHGFRHLPVIDDDGQVSGVVSLRRVVGAAQTA